MSDRIVGDVFDQLTAFRDENITLKAERDDLLALVREMLPELEEYASATGCDHEVGLCACGLNRIVADARALLSRLDGPVTP